MPAQSQPVDLISKFYRSLTLTLGLSIALLSLWPLDELPRVIGSDKLHHLIAYAALSLPVSIAKPRETWLWLMGVIVFGGLIELLQPLSNRYAEWLDFAANCSGVAMGIVLGHWLSNQKSALD
ncbi:MAG: VanZ family protein [Gammaproteobacteria bacterium]|nr:VanZ family protein [Gammaproteobacteria bacterium]